jgi:hypothetical protein
MTEVVSLISVVIALAAVYVAIWQVRENARNVAKSNSLPVLSQIARTWRSSEMRGTLREHRVSTGQHGFQRVRCAR